MSSETTTDTRHSKTSNNDLIKSSTRAKPVVGIGHLRHHRLRRDDLQQQQQEGEVQQPEDDSRKEGDGSSFSSSKLSVTSGAGSKEFGTTTTAERNAEVQPTNKPRPPQTNEAAPPSSQRREDQSAAIRGETDRASQSPNDPIPSTSHQLPEDSGRPGHSGGAGLSNEEAQQRVGDGAESHSSRGDRVRVRFSSDLVYREHWEYKEEYPSGSRRHGPGKETRDSEDSMQRRSRHSERPKIKSRKQIQLERRRGGEVMKKEEETQVESETPRPDFVKMLDVRLRALDLMIGRSFPEENLLARQQLQPRRFRRSRKMDSRWQAAQDQLVLQDLLVRLRAARERREASQKTTAPPVVAGLTAGGDNSDTLTSSTITLGIRVTPEGQSSDELLLNETSGSAKTNDETKNLLENRTVRSVNNELTVTDLTVHEGKQRLADSGTDFTLRPGNQFLPVISAEDNVSSRSRHRKENFSTRRKNVEHVSLNQQLPLIKNTSSEQEVDTGRSAKDRGNVSVKQPFPSIVKGPHTHSEDQSASCVSASHQPQPAHNADRPLRPHSESCLGLRRCHGNKSNWLKEIISEQQLLKRMSYLNAFAPKIIHHMQRDGKSSALRRFRVVGKTAVLSKTWYTKPGASFRGKLLHEGNNNKGVVSASLPLLVSLSTKTTARPTTSFLTWRIRQKDAVFRKLYDANSRHVSHVSPVRSASADTSKDSKDSGQSLPAAAEDTKEKLHETQSTNADRSLGENSLNAEHSDKESATKARAEERSQLNKDGEEYSENEVTVDTPQLQSPSCPDEPSPPPPPAKLDSSPRKGAAVASSRSLPVSRAKESSRDTSQRRRLASDSGSKKKKSVPSMSERVADVQRIYGSSWTQKQQALAKKQMQKVLLDVTDGDSKPG